MNKANGMRLCMPDTLVSANDNQFTSTTFQKFCTDNGIDQISTISYE